MSFSLFACLPLAFWLGRCRFLVTRFIIIGVLLLFSKTLWCRERVDIDRVLRLGIIGRKVRGGIGRLRSPIIWKRLGRCGRVATRRCVVNYRYGDRTGRCRLGHIGLRPLPLLCPCPGWRWG